MFGLLFDLEDYSTSYRATRDSYLKVSLPVVLSPHALALALDLASYPIPRCKQLMECSKHHCSIYNMHPLKLVWLRLEQAANDLKLANGPAKASRDAYVAASATYTRSLFE